ncbi:hypothetical protein M885DRAFT_559407 [Pelagophyceae sp. CCMP2097]|nr:hypothetical protein M885DRAFT_559407 [Pelagophyceae sp. CCMP2097]
MLAGDCLVTLTTQGADGLPNTVAGALKRGEVGTDPRFARFLGASIAQRLVEPNARSRTADGDVADKLGDLESLARADESPLMAFAEGLAFGTERPAAADSLLPKECASHVATDVARYVAALCEATGVPDAMQYVLGKLRVAMHRSTGLRSSMGDARSLEEINALLQSPDLLTEQFDNVGFRRFIHYVQ